MNQTCFTLESTGLESVVTRVPVSIPFVNWYEKQIVYFFLCNLLRIDDQFFPCFYCWEDLEYYLTSVELIQQTKQRVVVSFREKCFDVHEQCRYRFVVASWLRGIDGRLLLRFEIEKKVTRNVMLKKRHVIDKFQRLLTNQKKNVERDWQIKSFCRYTYM